MAIFVGFGQNLKIRTIEEHLQNDIQRYAEIYFLNLLFESLIFSNTIIIHSSNLTKLKTENSYFLCALVILMSNNVNLG